MPVSAAREQSVKSAYHCATLLDNWDEDRRQFGQPVPTTSGAGVLDGNTTHKTSYQTVSAAQAAEAKPPSCFAAEAPRILLFHHGDIGNIQTHCHTMTELSHTDRNKVAYTNEEVLDMPGVSNRRHKTAALHRSTMGFSTTARLDPSGTGFHADDVTPAMQREAAYMQSLASTVHTNPSSASQTQTSSAGSPMAEDGSAYEPPRLLPVGRVAERERLMTTKNVSTDATGVHLYENLEAYPLTSSKCVGKMMKSCDNPMHKTNLRVHYMEDDY